MTGSSSGWRGPYRDDRIHVLSRRCSTCVFRPGNLMSLEPGRLRDLVDGNVRADSALTCHQTLEYSGHDDVDGAVCRGFYDAYADQTLPLRMAQLLGLITEQEPPS